MQPSSSTNGENFPLNKTVKNDEEELPSCDTFELVVLLDKFTLGDKGQDDASVPNKESSFSCNKFSSANVQFNNSRGRRRSSVVML